MKAVILTTQRSGSTFLKDCLDAHPSVRCYGELLVGGNLNPPRIISRRRYLTKAYRYIGSRAWDPVNIMDRYYGGNAAPVIVFKAMYNHLRDQRARDYLVEHKEIRVIHLRRDNLLKQYVSKLLLSAKREEGWQPHTTTEVPVVSVRVSADRAIAEMRRVQDCHDDFERLLSDHPKIEVVYEEMFNGATLSPKTWSRLADLLEIEPAETSSELIKMNPNKLRPMVENYDELAEALSGTEYERFLD